MGNQFGPSYGACAEVLKFQESKFTIILIIEDFDLDNRSRVFE